MEKAVISLDIDPLQIGNYTPYELTIVAKQKVERQTKEFENLIALAWHTEAFARQKRLPGLEKILRDIRRKPNKKNSVSDQILKAMAAEKGVKI